MKPAPFAYARAESLEAVFDAFDAHGGQVRLLAGGQSLIAALNLRLDQPALLLDINRVPGLAGISATEQRLRIGALTRHAEIAESAVVRSCAPLLSEAAPHIAHAAIRNRGTIGGSIALADPAAEWPACAVALEADILLLSRAGERRVPATAFFQGLYETALRPGELVAAVEIPVAAPGERQVFVELARRHGDYAIVGLAAVLRGTAPRFAFLGVGATPVRARRAEAAWPDIAAAQAALEQDLDPPGDLHGPPALRRHLARVLLGRAAARLLEPA